MDNSLMLQIFIQNSPFRWTSEICYVRSADKTLFWLEKSKSEDRKNIGFFYHVRLLLKIKKKVSCLNVLKN